MNTMTMIISIRGQKGKLETLPCYQESIDDFGNEEMERVFYKR
jgi:hypothetical protein